MGSGIVDLLVPREYYEKVLKDQFHNSAIQMFDEFASKAQTDIAANKKTVADYYIAKKNISFHMGISSRFKLLKVLLIIMSIALVLASIVLLIIGFTGYMMPLFLTLGFLFVIIGAGGFVLVKLVINNKIASAQKKIDDFTAQSNNLLTQAYEQMRGLNSMYDYGMFPKLVEQAVPLFKMDKRFDPKKYQYLHEKYGFQEETDPNISTVFVQSGSILGNPFVLQRNYITKMRDRVYEGSIVIHWTTTVRTKNGTKVVPHTQTLTATVTKPEPYYYFDTWLIYGNDAADRLSFSRVPSKANHMNEKQIKNYAKNFQKTLDDRVKATMGKEHPFTAMANTEFEAIFNALDRDNDVQFRLLFTPLAQKSMLDLLENREPYGDDFVFLKRKCLNYIKSAHSQTITYLDETEKFMNFDYEVAKNFFVEQADLFFKGLYFDLAPLMAIPLYQQHESREYIYNEEYYGNVTSYETEASANAFDRKYFMPEGSATDCILKSKFLRKNGKADMVNIEAYAYKAIEHVTVISKLGGDGHYHDIPVKWIEYQPIMKRSLFEIQPINTERHSRDILADANNDEKIVSFIGRNAILYRRGLLALLMLADSGYDSEYIDNILSK